ncbi:MAG: hypothetical protein WA609_06545 [Terriglobales bacterium]
MQLLIDNLDGRGPLDYSAFVDMSQGASVVRKLNSLAAFRVGLFSAKGGFAVPAAGARVLLVRSDNSGLFTGYLMAAPSYRYLGWADQGPLYSYELVAFSDAMLLDQKAPPPEPPFVAQSAGGALERLTLDALPGWFDLSGVQAGDPIPYFSVDPSKNWAVSAAEIALAARFSYRDWAGKLSFAPLGQNTYALAENDPAFSPDNLQLESVNRLVNDLTVLGQLEPAAHVKDYFVGDDYTTTFYMSQIPFTRSNQIPLYNRTILNEEYTELDPTHWMAVDPTHALSVSDGQLLVSGGNGQDGQTCLDFVEQIELGGATVLEHGDVVFNAASNGVIGGLYTGAVAVGNCVAGFRITPSGTDCSIQSLVAGALTGTPLVTQAGHHYVFTTYIYPTEIYRMQQVFHSSAHPSGSARGGASVTCDARIVLQVHDIDPENPATQVAPATVLYDGVIGSAPGFCTYVLINAISMQCSVAFTYIFLAIDALVRTTLSGATPLTAQVGSLIDGAECKVSNTPALQFYPEFIPALNEAIEVTYRSSGRAAARIINSASITAHRNGADDGVRGSVRRVAIPAPRTSADCEIAALALLDDAGQGWAGEYQAWSRFLPGGAEDIFPGDGLAVNVPSRAALFLAIVREVDLTVLDLTGETVRYTLKFVDAGDPSLNFGFSDAVVEESQVLTPIDVTQAGTTYLADLTNAEIETDTLASTTITIDAGFTPPAGWGIEVRYSDTGWGAGNNRNLIGRFTTSSFTLPRYARGQTYFLRSYDNSSPAKYSRYSTALHVDYPL